ncbi:MAG TPA: esterase-like activity of phytase family protein [Phycisphaerales bacterium]|nr:esterase-like activity of phytase family protein [Phycisphaerales bacterium]
MLGVCAVVLALGGQPAGAEMPALREVSRLDIPSDHSWLGTRVGGISGIDYDPDWQTWALISDDKGQHGPVRAYLADIQFQGDQLTNVEVTRVLPMCWGSGRLMTEDGFDPEAIRILPLEDYFGDPTLLWASEGAPDRGVPTTMYETCTGATRMDTWNSPESYRPSRRKGIKNNKAIESVAIIGRRLAVVASEEPLKQDGSEYIRFLTYDLDTPETEPVAAIAYPVGPTPESMGAGFTGLVDLLALKDGRFLATERSWNFAGMHDVRIFLVETAGATDVLGMDSLAGADFTPARKTLIADLGDTVGNGEGLCFGPVLPDGKRSLVLVSDNNFKPGEPTHFVAYEVTDPDGLVEPVDRRRRK